MKRGAEKQLSKDDHPEEASDGEDPGLGFKRADEAVLGTRKIRGLPKRLGAAGGAPPAGSTNGAAPPAASTSTASLFGSQMTSGPAAVPAPSTTSRFGSFAGFGASTSSSTPFSFSPSTPSAAAAANPAPSFGAPAAKPPSTGASSSSSSSAVSSSATSAAKSFASFLGSSSPAATTSAPPTASAPKTNGFATTTPVTSFTAPTPTPAPAPLTAPTPSASTSKAPSSAELNYYTSLRGLNISFLQTLNKAIEEDPFADIAGLLEQYNAFRIDVQKKYDDAEKNGAGSAASASGSTSKSAEEKSLKKEASMPSLPPVPTSFAGFKFAGAEEDSSKKTGGGFTPTLDTSAKPSSSGFTFPPTVKSASAPTKTEEPKPNSSPFGASTASTGFTFGAPPSTGTGTGFTFGAPKPAAAVASATPAVVPSTPSKSLFGSSDPSSSLFGTPKSSGFAFTSSTPKKEEPKEDKKEEEDKPASKPSTTSAFGFSSSPSPFTFGAPATGGSTPGGSGTSSGSSNPFNFGRTNSGSIGNPVGFAFGASSKTFDAPASGGSGGAASGFTFGAPPSSSSSSSSSVFAFAPAKPAAADDESSAPATGESNADEGQAQAAALALAASQHDAEGAGEEEEDTVHGVRAKVFRLLKDRDGNSYWADLGVGVARLKKHKTSDVRRILCRNSSNGKIMINFNLYVGLDPKLDAKSKVVSFVGQDESGASAPFKIRTKTLDQAQDLKDTLDREIEFVKAKEE